MSEELEWEFFDLLEMGKFLFPLFEQEPVRQIIRHLLSRGIQLYDIAESVDENEDAISAWLNKTGQVMVGEQIMDWLNELKLEYDDISKNSKEGDIKVRLQQHREGKSGATSAKTSLENAQRGAARASAQPTKGVFAALGASTLGAGLAAVGKGNDISKDATDGADKKGKKKKGKR